MGECKSCVHWAKADRWDAILAGLGRCERVIAGWRVADKASENLLWTEDGHGYPGDDDYVPSTYMAARAKALSDAKATIWDGSEYVAEMLTAPDFFCALFAALSATQGDDRDLSSPPTSDMVDRSE